MSKLSDKKLVVLRTLVGPSRGARFYTTNSENPEYSAKGEKWYEIIDYADTSEEAQSKCGLIIPGAGSLVW